MKFKNDITKRLMMPVFVFAVGLLFGFFTDNALVGFFGGIAVLFGWMLGQAESDGEE